MKIHTTRTAQFTPSSPKPGILSGQKGQQIAPPEYGLDFADNPNLPIQPVMDSRQQATPASLPPPNNTGLPDNLKEGVEQLSGHSLDDVKVHYNSSKPAQLHALAYAQGTDIHIGPGQEKHLPHEAWHVVQQKEGRVRPTMKLKGKVDVNDDVGLEREATKFGGLAMQIGNKNADKDTGNSRKLTSSPHRQSLPGYQVMIQRNIIQFAGHYLLKGISTSEFKDIHSATNASLSANLDHDPQQINSATGKNYLGWNDISRQALENGSAGRTLSNRNDLPPHKYIGVPAMQNWPENGSLTGFQRVAGQSWLNRLSHPNGMGLRVQQVGPPVSAGFENEVQNHSISLEVYYWDGQEMT